jgi:hypothetical protein
MAYTERYVTSAASGGGDGSSGSPWTLAEAFSNASAGDRVNIQSDAAYSSGAVTLTNSGTSAQAICYRGYNSTIGDLENQGRNSDTSLNTTNFPAITTTGAIVPVSHTIFQNLNLSGSVSGSIVGSGASPDQCSFIECSITNTASNASARALYIDNQNNVVNCDIICSSTLHAQVLLMDAENNIIASKIVGKSTTAANLVSGLDRCVFIGCVFWGTSSLDGINVEASGNLAWPFFGNTFYNLNTCIKLPNSSIGMAYPMVNNHATDSSEWLNNLYSATANKYVIEVNNRTRDITTARTGIGDGVNSGEVTTDTGGPSTDYTDTSNGDFTLISGAPGEDVGIGYGDT